MNSFILRQLVWPLAKLIKPTSASGMVKFCSGALVAPLLCLQIATVACAADGTESRPEEPRAPSSVGQCYPLAKVTEGIESEGGRLIQMTPEQFQFARGMFFVSSLGTEQLPLGDRALLSELPDGEAGLIFADGENACGLSLLSAAAVQMLMAVGAGSIIHVGNGA